MRILSAKIENYLGVKLFHAAFDPERNLFEITGKNGQGKTGSLDGIWAAIAGKAAIADNPIRDGEETALLHIDLGHLTITRKFKRNIDRDYTTSLVVTTPEGARYPEPQKLLNGLFNTIALDPIEFMRKQPKEQTKTFRSLIGDFDFDANDETIKDLSNTRLEANREVKNLQVRVDGFGLPAKVPCEHIDETALIDQLTNAQTHNQDRQNELSRREAIKAEAKELRDGAIQKKIDCTRDILNAEDEGQRLIGEAEEKSAELQRKAKENAVQLRDEAQSNLVEAEKVDTELAGLFSVPESIDPIDIKEQLEAATASNAIFVKKKQYETLAEELRLKKLGADNFDKQIKDLRQMAEDAVTSADLPVPGINFDDGGLTYNGFPLSQASKAEQIRVCCSIVAALNPELRICRISDGSLLDGESFELLKGFAKKYNIQTFIETVESTREGAIVIEAGEITNQE